MTLDRVAVITVGIGDWFEHSIPFLQSVKKFEPDVPVIIVDAIADHLSSYAQGINKGLEIVTRSYNFDWIIISNNDVLCRAPFVEYLSTLDKKTLYGNKIHTKHNLFKVQAPFIDGWIYAMSDEILLHVGLFDEQFLQAGFEDADYCFRCYKKGYSIQGAELPFEHLEARMRFTNENYSQTRLDNLDKLVKKHGLERIQK